MAYHGPPQYGQAHNYPTGLEEMLLPVFVCVCVCVCVSERQREKGCIGLGAYLSLSVCAFVFVCLKQDKSDYDWCN